MPKRTDIQSILILGAGPIVIGQACEFDYSGVQACKVLRSEGYRVILINSNPATIMTDPEFADATYIEPLTVEIAEKVIAQERPDALLPTVGGQTGLNLGVELAEKGILDKYGVQLIGASLEAIKLAEDRQLFKEAIERIGLKMPKSVIAKGPDEALTLAAEVGYPLLVRASFTLGGTGGGVAYNEAELIEAVKHGVRSSPVGQVLVDQSVLGWKEYELEVMRDRADNFVVVCSIENLDAMGVHTGDSITVAPAQTLTDKEYQRLRDAARAVLNVVGVETGGSNVQFAVNPVDGEVLIIEMNPRVSRSSALASKATGFPIAKMAALLAVGYTLDEIPNDITRETPASFEPSLDYVVVKLPRWAFEKFPGVDPTLGPQMKSVGEAMSIGRTFKEALGKGLRSLEIGDWRLEIGDWRSEIEKLRTPTRERLFQTLACLHVGAPQEAIIEATWYDPWFVDQLAQIVEMEQAVAEYSLDTLPVELLRQAKRFGLSDETIAGLLSPSSIPPDGGEVRGGNLVRQKRLEHGIHPAYLRVDTCAAEFEAFTPYLYSAYESQSEANPTDRKKVMILGGGPNRIGQGIEFDYCCVHACFALSEAGYETIMVNCNPETVSTDYDTADRLYFEPLTLEDVLNIVDEEQPDGVIVQFGGQTPLNLAEGLAAAGVPIWGTSPEAIAMAEDREQFERLLDKLGIDRPPNGIATNLAEARTVADRIGFPLLVRPSFVLGGRAMAIVYDDSQFENYVTEAIAAAPGRPILLDHYLEDAFEVDVDAVSDGQQVVIGGIMQHIEEAGIHSGDSACVLPPYKISAYHQSIIRDYTERLGQALNVRGLLNVQYAIKDDIVYVLEVNPRASRTVPFVSKATNTPLAKIAARVMAGELLEQIGFTEQPELTGFFVKEAVLPFRKFMGVDAALGPEMRSTGEVMGHAARFGAAFAKAELAAGDRLPRPGDGKVFITVNDFDKSAALKIGRDLAGLGFELVATQGTAAMLRRVGVEVQAVNKYSEGDPIIIEMMQTGKIALIINTPLGGTSYLDGQRLRTEATRLGIPLVTTLTAAQAAVNGIKVLSQESLQVRSLQDLHKI
ncbi:MAG: carbamoyl-phosphate synthase large subunit [Anaerolineaceae bacterium]|nr:carbamoyl-phosphate synthase large subunit [Anaerolineaceae bacterium]MCB9100481.1 carbamoyl-phosphate synthase large subunit [Anaerolineales bacterium]